MATHEYADADQLRRDHQQSLVAEFGRSALTGADVVGSAIAAVEEGLGADRVALFEPDGDDLIPTSAVGWLEGERIAIAADSPIAHTFRDVEPTLDGALAVAPVRGESAVIGVLAAGAPQPLSPDDLLFLRSVANLLAATVARRRIEGALGFLAEAGRVLAESLDYDVTLSTLAGLVVPRLADWCIVDLVEPDGGLRRVAVRAADPHKQQLLDALHRDYPPVAGSGQPAAQALARGRTVHFPGFTPETLRETTLDDRHFELMLELEPHSAMAVPLTVQGRVLGALTFAWSESGRRYQESDAVLAEELGRRAALAIENSRLYQSELDAQQRIAFIVEASDVLASSLDYEETLNALARLAVPRLGDWCVIYIVGPDGSIARRAVEHAGGRQETVRAILEAHPIRPDAEVGVPQVIRTGVSELSEIASPISTAGDVEAPEQLADALEEIKVHSTMCVPLIARRRTLGAILFVSAESHRVFDETDLRLAEDLAARAAVAVDNSRLFNEAEQRAEAAEALDSIADGVFLVDSGGTIRLWNAAAETITGIAADKARGRRASEIFEGWGEISAADTAPRTVPATIEGRELWLSISGVTSSDGVAYAFRDVTADRQLDRMKSDFVATVSHELRTPLAAVYGAALTLAERDFSEREDLRRDLVTQIAEQAARLSAIVDDILFVGKLESGGLRLEAAVVDPGEIARAAVDAARLRAEADVALETADDLPPIETDGGRLRQVLDNLLDNAIKYSPGRGAIVLRVAADRRSTRFAVSDHGVGIPAADLPRIFEKFYRVDPHQTGGVNGTGLGLYVCRELVERMDGRITVSSTPGLGSTFVVELPRR